MPKMYCPKCGRELDLDSGEIRFCRYCGFELADTKDALRGYSEHKRIGFSVVTWSYALLLIVALVLHGEYVSLDTPWVYWLITALIVVSASLFISAAVSALKPAIFLTGNRRKKATLKAHEDKNDPGNSEGYDAPLLPPIHEAVTNLSDRGATKEALKQPRSVTEETTKRLSES